MMLKQNDKPRKQAPSKFSNLQYVIYALIMAAAVMFGSHGLDNLSDAAVAAATHNSK